MEGAQAGYSGVIARSAAPPIESLPVVRVVRRGWRKLAIAALVGSAAAIGADSLMPSWYRAEARLSVLPHDDLLAPGHGNSVDEAGANLPVLATVLHSRSVGLGAVEQLHLERVYQAPSPDRALGQLWGHVFIATERKANLITLAAEDRDPVRARDLVVTLATLATERNAALWKAGDEDRRHRLEARFAEAGKQLSSDEEAMRAFREQNHLVDLERQVRASVDQVAALQSDLSKKTVELLDARAFAGKDSSEVSLARQGVRSVSGEVSALSVGKELRPPLVPMVDIPRLELAHGRLKRVLDLDGERYMLLARQLEELRVAETRPLGRAEIIDEPTVPLARTRPPLPIIGVVGALLGVILALLVLSGRSLRAPVAAVAGT